MSQWIELGFCSVAFPYQLNVFMEFVLIRWPKPGTCTVVGVASSWKLWRWKQSVGRLETYLSSGPERETRYDTHVHTTHTFTQKNNFIHIPHTYHSPLGQDVTVTSTHLTSHSHYTHITPYCCKMFIFSRSPTEVHIASGPYVYSCCCWYWF